MKFMIRCDIEGVTGVTTYDQAENSALGKAMLMNDLLAVIEGLLADDDHEIVVYDEHTDGRNVDLAALPEQVSVICGKPPYRPDWGGLDSSFDAMLMVGFHARAGTPGALLPHSYCRRNLGIRINGSDVGEIGVEASIAGEAGVPLWLVAGDSAGVAEAQALVPGLRTVAVKEAMGESAALCHPPKRTAKWLYEAAEALPQDPPDVIPLVFRAPIALDVELADSAFLHAVRSKHPELIEGEMQNTVHLTGDTVTEVWAWYLEIEAQIAAAIQAG